MSDTYTKLFRSLAASTIVSEPLATRWLWVTLLSQADKAGRVYGSIPGLARLANITLPDTETALAALMSPDPYSRTPDHEGRRLEAFDGGWRLLNHAKYAAMRDEAERAEYKREWDRKHRPSGHARKAEQVPTVRPQSDSPTETDSPDPTSTNTNTKKEQKPKQERSPKGSRLPPDWQPDADEIAYAEAKRPDVDWREEAEKFRDYWHGATGKGAVRNGWSGTWRNWIRRADGRPRAGPSGALTPSRQMHAVANLLGENVHDLASQPRRLVRHADPPLSGQLVPAEPRRLSGSGCAGESRDAVGTPSLGETSFGMDG